MFSHGNAVYPYSEGFIVNTIYLRVCPDDANSIEAVLGNDDRYRYFLNVAPSDLEGKIIFRNGIEVKITRKEPGSPIWGFTKINKNPNSIFTEDTKREMLISSAYNFEPFSHISW